LSSQQQNYSFWTACFRISHSLTIILYLRLFQHWRSRKSDFNTVILVWLFLFISIILVVIMRESEWLNLSIENLDELHILCIHQIWSPMTFGSLNSLREAEWSEATWCLCFSSCDHGSLRRAEFWEYPDCLYGMDGLHFFDHSKQGRILY
jgi:hypothetical protein